MLLLCSAAYTLLFGSCLMRRIIIVQPPGLSSHGFSIVVRMEDTRPVESSGALRAYDQRVLLCIDTRKTFARSSSSSCSLECWFEGGFWAYVTRTESSMVDVKQCVHSILCVFLDECCVEKCVCIYVCK